MLAPLRAPLVTALYSAVGVLLAKTWYDGSRWPSLLVLLVSLALALGLAPLARRNITTNPRSALRLFESYSWVNGLLAAVLAALTIVVTIEFASVAGKVDPQKELVTQLSAAITSLLGGLLVATKDEDESLGKRIAKEFQARFTMAGQTKNAEGKVPLKKGSPSLIAVFTNYDYGWTDWSSANRRERVEELQKNLAADRTA